MDVTGTAALGVGAAAAAGVLLVARELVPAPPALGASLRRLHPGTPDGVGGPGGWAPRAATGRRPRVLPLPGESLALLRRTPAEYYAGLAAGAAAGLALPVLLAGMFAAAGRLPLSAAVAAGGVAVGLAAGGLGALTVHYEVASRARRVRRQFRPVVATFLSLVAMERAAGHGSVESLERAALVGDGPAMRRIREALQRARTHHRPPWEELQMVAAQLGIPELGDVAQIMQNSGVAGAQVHHTLLQRARSLRDQIRTEALAEAERTTTKLEIPGVLLLVLLVAYFLYPLTRQIEL